MQKFIKDCWWLLLLLLFVKKDETNQTKPQTKENTKGKPLVVDNDVTIGSIVDDSSTLDTLPTSTNGTTKPTLVDNVVPFGNYDDSYNYNNDLLDNKPVQHQIKGEPIIDDSVLDSKDHLICNDCKDVY